MIYKNTIEQELDRNRRYISSKKIRDSLEAFAMDLKVKDNLTDHRVMFYLIRLRVLSRMESEEEFLNPTVASLKSIIMKLSAKSTISPRTVEDYKQAIRKYYKWKLPPSEFAEKVGWIHVKGNTVNRLKKSEDMITKEEIEKLVNGYCKCVFLPSGEIYYSGAPHHAGFVHFFIYWIVIYVGVKLTAEEQRHLIPFCNCTFKPVCLTPVALQLIVINDNRNVLLAVFV